MRINKRGMESKTLVYWLIAVAVVAGFMIVYFALKNKDMSMLDFFKNLLRFR